MLQKLISLIIFQGGSCEKKKNVPTIDLGADTHVQTADNIRVLSKCVLRHSHHEQKLWRRLFTANAIVKCIVLKMKTYDLHKVLQSALVSLLNCIK